MTTMQHHNGRVALYGWLVTTIARFRHRDSLLRPRFNKRVVLDVMALCPCLLNQCLLLNHTCYSVVLHTAYVANGPCQGAWAQPATESSATFPTSTIPISISVLKNGFYETPIPKSTYFIYGVIDLVLLLEGIRIRSWSVTLALCNNTTFLLCEGVQVAVLFIMWVNGSLLYQKGRFQWWWHMLLGYGQFHLYHIYAERSIFS